MFSSGCASLLPVRSCRRARRVREARPVRLRQARGRIGHAAGVGHLDEGQSAVFGGLGELLHGPDNGLRTRRLGGDLGGPACPRSGGAARSGAIPSRTATRITTRRERVTAPPALLLTHAPARSRSRLRQRTSRSRRGPTNLDFPSHSYLKQYRTCDLFAAASRDALTSTFTPTTWSAYCVTFSRWGSQRGKCAYRQGPGGRVEVSTTVLGVDAWARFQGSGERLRSRAPTERRAGVRARET